MPHPTNPLPHSLADVFIKTPDGWLAPETEHVQSVEELVAGIPDLSTFMNPGTVGTFDSWMAEPTSNELSNPLDDIRAMMAKLREPQEPQPWVIPQGEVGVWMAHYITGRPLAECRDWMMLQMKGA